MRTGWPAAWVLVLWGTLAFGQGAIYESQGPSGPVFSDQPSPGATQVILPPPNVIAPEQWAPAQPTSPPAQADHRPFYRSLGISSPANGDTIHTNTGAFDVQVDIVPTLRDGDRIELKLDGTPLQRLFRSGAISVTESDWQAAAAEDVQHSLQAAVVSGDGGVLVESPVVSFYAHRATVKRRRP
jgi:hypothetical protein